MAPAAAYPSAGGGLLPASPWSDDTLTSITLQDVFGWLDTELLPMGRSEAMSVPAVAAARHRVCGTLARLPVRAYLGDTDTQWGGGSPDLLAQPDPAEPHQQTLLKTLDDLFFDGAAYWGVTRLDSTTGRPSQVTYLPRQCVQVDQDGRVTIDTAFTTWLATTQGRTILGTALDSPWLIFFAGPHPGLLNFGARTLRSGLRLDRAASRAADNPVPSIELHQTNDADMSDAAVRDLIRQWMSARRGENGGVGYTSAGVEARAMGQQPEQLLINGRNQQAVEIARLAGIPAASIDAGIPGTSLTYANLADRLRDLVDFGLQPYGVAITDRLSMDDCLPHGVSARFDYSSLTAPTAAAQQTPLTSPPSTEAGLPESVTP
jgi:phage portal protein BeeE